LLKLAAMNGKALKLIRNIIIPTSKAATLAGSYSYWVNISGAL